MIAAAVAKECLQLWRDKGALASMFMLPVVFIGFFGFVFQGAEDGESGGDGDPPVLALVVENGDRLGGRIRKILAASGTFTLKEVTEAGEARRLVAREEARAALIVPEGFNPLGGNPAELSLDTALGPQVVEPTRGAVEGILAQAVFGFGGGERPPLVRVTSPPGKKAPLEDVDSFQISVPGNAVLFIYFLALGLAMSFVQERSTGAWRRLLAAPVAPPLLVVAKLVPFFVIGCLQMAFFLLLGVLGFGMAVGGSAVGLAVLTAAVVFSAVGLGLLISAFGGNERQVAGFSTIVVLVMGLAGGCMFPRILMPETVRTIGLFTPHAWALDGYYDLIIRSGTTTTDVLPQVAALAGFGAAFTTAGALAFRWRR